MCTPYVAVIDSEATKQIAEQLLMEGDQEHAIREVHWQCFLAYCDCNHLDPRADYDRAIPTFAASLLLQKRCEATVKVYLRHVHAVHEDVCTPISIVMRALTARIARKGSTHALDLEASDMCRLLEAIFSRGTAWDAVATLFLWWSGMRCADIAELKRRDVSWSPQILRVQIRFSKTVRNVHDSVELRIPSKWLPIGPTKVREALQAHISQGDPEEELFAWATSARINYSLRAAWHQCGGTPVAGARHYPTTYTFRRAFVHSIEKRFTNPDTGAVEWNRVIQYTMHQTERILRGHYVLKVGETEPPRRLLEEW
jgi:integrase